MSANKSQHSAGWYAGALVFWLLTAWLITVGLSSIIPQIFWPGSDQVSGSTSCAAELRALRDELVGHAREHLEHPQQGGSGAQLAFFERWDKRLFSARPTCQKGAERDAFTQLNRLRHGMHALLERFKREEAPRLQRIEQLLGAGQEARAQLWKMKSYE